MLDTIEILERLGEQLKIWEERQERYKKPSSGWPSGAVLECRRDIERLVTEIVTGRTA